MSIQPDSPEERRRAAVNHTQRLLPPLDEIPIGETVSIPYVDEPLHFLDITCLEPPDHPSENQLGHILWKRTAEGWIVEGTQAKS